MILFDRGKRKYIDSARGITAWRGNGLDRDMKRYLFHIKNPDREYTLEVFVQNKNDITAHSIDPSIREKRNNWEVEIGPNPKIIISILSADVDEDEFHLKSTFAALAREALFATFYNAYGADALEVVPFTIRMGWINSESEEYSPPPEYFEDSERISYPIKHVTHSIGDNAGYQL